MFTNTGAMLTNSDAVKYKPFVFVVSIKDGRDDLFITQNANYTGTCDLYK